MAPITIVVKMKFLHVHSQANQNNQMVRHLQTNKQWENGLASYQVK